MGEDEDGDDEAGMEMSEEEEYVDYAPVEAVAAITVSMQEHSISVYATATGPALASTEDEQAP